MKLLVFVCAMLVLVYGAAFVAAVAPVVDLGECYSGSLSIVSVAFDPGYVPDNYTGVLNVVNTCEGGSAIEYLQPVTLLLGDVLSGEMVVESRSVFVDSVARPDLDVPARITFKDVDFAVEPSVQKDGEPCPVGVCTNEVFNPQAQTFAVTVAGFSNYTLQGRQDFTLYSDFDPELRTKVYQTIDLGDLYRAYEFKCLVQLYAKNDAGQFVLVQTNPQRKSQGLIVSPDPNLPESLGYFKTENGIANVYFDGSTLAGYENFEYVAQCASNDTKLIFEESVSTRYHPVGRSLVGRGVWFSDGNNMFYLVIGTVIFVIVGLLLWKAFRMVKRWN